MAHEGVGRPARTVALNSGELILPTAKIMAECDSVHVEPFMNAMTSALATTHVSIDLCRREQTSI